MKNVVLDNLSVPQPPYRMARFSAAPSARLATSKNWDQDLEEAHRADQLQRLVEQEELPSPKEELKDISEKPSVETLERIGQEADEAVQRIEGLPALGTEQGRAEDEKNKKEAITEIERAALRTLKAVETLKVPSDPLEGLEPKGTKKEREEDARIAERMRPAVPPRTPAEKAAITRQHTAALKEDAARTLAKELEGGIEFEETATQRAGRLAQEALQRLNEFKNAKDRNASPEEIEFNSQRADIAQRRLEAAQRGEPIPDERVDMDRVKAAAKNTTETPLIKDEKQELVDLPLQSEVPAEIPPTPITEEEITVEAEPVLGTVVEGKGKVVDYESSGKAIYEPIQKPEDVAPEAVYIRPDTPEGKKPAEARAEAERAQEVPARDSSVEQVEVLKKENENKQREIETLKQRLAEQEATASRESRAEEKASTANPAMEAIREIDPIGFKQLEKSIEPSGLKRFWESTAKVSDKILGHISTRLEKRAKDMLADRDERIKALETKAEAHAEKSWLGKGKWRLIPGGKTIVKPLLEGGIMDVYQIRLKWHKARRESISARLQSHAAWRKAYEENVVDSANTIAAQEELGIALLEQEVNQYKEMVSRYDAKLDTLETERGKAQQKFLEAVNFEDKRGYRDALRVILAQIEECSAVRGGYIKLLAQNSGELAAKQKKQNVLLGREQEQNMPLPEEYESTRLRPRVKRKIKTTKKAA